MERFQGFLALPGHFGCKICGMGWKDPKMTNNLTKVLCQCGKRQNKSKLGKKFRKIQNYSTNDVIRAKKAGLDKNGSKCVGGVSGRVGGVSGACRGRVGRVSGLNFQVSSCFQQKTSVLRLFARKCVKFQHFSTKTIENSKKTSETDRTALECQFFHHFDLFSTKTVFRATPGT